MLQDPSDKSMSSNTAGLRRVLILIPSIANHNISNKVLWHRKVISKSSSCSTVMRQGPSGFVQDWCPTRLLNGYKRQLVYCLILSQKKLLFYHMYISGISYHCKVLVGKSTDLGITSVTSVTSFFFGSSWWRQRHGSMAMGI